MSKLCKSSSGPNNLWENREKYENKVYTLPKLLDEEVLDCIYLKLVLF